MSALFEIDKYHTRTQISAGVYELTGNVRVRGFQASVAGRIARGWQVFGGYTFLDAEIVEASRSTARKARYRPTHRATARRCGLRTI